MEPKSIAVVGLGYVGLPLAVHLARAGFEVIGVDINKELVAALEAGLRPNRDLPSEVFPIPSNMRATYIMPGGVDVYIVAVPTPDLGAKGMDAQYVVNSCRDIGKVMRDGATVVIESTVTPGSTNGFIRETIAEAKGDRNFHLAMSPERVNPGDHYFYEMGNTDKLVGTSNGAKEVCTAMYRRIFESVVTVGVEEAELAKAFENMQRDVNIALMNELAMQCEEKGLNYADVVKGLRTKKTSPIFTSGMVGGHCIPVDPYFVAEYYGTHDNLALHGRDVNIRYIEHLATLAIDYKPMEGPVLVIGKTYKPGVVDKRNSGAIKLHNFLLADHDSVEIHDIRLDGVYRGSSPVLVYGAVNHNPNLNIFEYYNCHSKCVFVNIGGGFTEAQTAPFHKVVNI